MCVSTGNQGLDIALAIGIGAATGGFGVSAAGSGGLFSTASAHVGSSIFSTLGWTSATLVPQAALGGAILGGVGSMAMSALMPQQPAEYPYPQYEQEPTYHSQQNQITGSGGAQAPAYLAKEMKRIKTAKNKEQPRATSSINTETFSGTGLQIA
jgi:hypothetical protein